ncbi:MAG: UDP-N-acetylmuramoyl-tripeptide--D-alanyl-D-alanine ligase [Robiginitomaculum sp.]|nr:MAG: UDP-N-acetylmuramoyl-tripeptide--D-alanyl-D-alanine ligase [Robiginitomaculum sp.]
MSVLWTHKDAATATNGTSVGAWEINGLSIDTRSLKPGDLFVPLKDIRDGHDFIPMALEKGAGAVMSEHPVADAPVLLVEDALQALRDLAIAARKRSSAKRIAVTGSVGKTSVKEMLAHVLRGSGNTHASIKSFNNHWGVPLTLAAMAQDTEYGVFEMGMNHAGELLDLTAVVRPDIAVITKIAPAHLAHFKSLADIASAKAEILTGLGKDGVAILPRDSEFYELFASKSPNVLSFGWHPKADAQILETTHTASGSTSVLKLAGRSLTLDLPVVGAHWVENAACVLLTAHTAGINLSCILSRLKRIDKIAGRGAVHALDIENHTINLIDESYNANPESMRAAIAALGLIKGRKIAVLGDMLELGPDELALHAALVIPLENAHIDKVLCCGAHMKALEQALPKTMLAGWYENADACSKGLKDILQNGDTIMVKGSNASGMGALVRSLTADNNKDKQHVL